MPAWKVMEESHSTPTVKNGPMWYFLQSFEFVESTEIQIYEQVEGSSARGIQFTHDQCYVRIDQLSKGS